VAVDLVEPGEYCEPTAGSAARVVSAKSRGSRGPARVGARANPGLYAYLRLAASTGARRSQLLALRWAEVDESRRAVAFTRALVEGPNGPVMRATKTHRTYRVELD
jgi:integrase